VKKEMLMPSENATAIATAPARLQGALKTLRARRVAFDEEVAARTADFLCDLADDRPVSERRKVEALNFLAFLASHGASMDWIVLGRGRA
jgi:hypothetical protein